jgi:hypothetical protein
MSINAKLGAVLFALTTLLGCTKEEDPNKVYDIVLNNGKTKLTLKIPYAYVDWGSRLPEGEDRLVRVNFSYPSMRPTQSRVAEDSVSLIIILEPNPNLTRSNIALNSILRDMKTPTRLPPRYVGKEGVFDIYTTQDFQTNAVKKEYFTHDQLGNLLNFREQPGLRSHGNRPYANALDLRYGFDPSLQGNQLEVDRAVTALIDQWLQK